MTTTKLNVRHDYLSLRVDYSKTMRVTLTTARYHEKATASPTFDVELLKRLMAAFSTTRKHVKEGGKFATILDWMQAVEALAARSAHPLVFVFDLEELAKA